jgi:uncharacterized membrane protein
LVIPTGTLVAVVAVVLTAAVLELEEPVTTLKVTPLQTQVHTPRSAAELGQHTVTTTAAQDTQLILVKV